ncbi:Glutaredoxin-related protein [Lentibacillus halodurans]|uniref:Glutaredoxin-related protein n=1 Tax=Lentibacillus halodurans TaxID=237679 RepID=A0A1I0XTY8_9BACI|nr:glutaredoxin family protein [Lentibacillus halodurans]SFB04374.1 Glutaredoxin-related protein [Lentibacillus halodurans]
MNGRDIIVYISENSLQCEQLLDQLDQSDIHYECRNVTENQKYLDQLQKEGIFGTPATFVNNKVVLGSQFNKIKQNLGMSEHYQSYNSFNKR